MGLQSLTKNGETMVRLKILRSYSGQEGKVRAGDIITVDARRARDILARPNRARIEPDAPVKPEPEIEPAKKSSRGTGTGRRSRTRKSSASGPATPSSASPAAPALPESNANTSGAHGAAGLTFTS